MKENAFEWYTDLKLEVIDVWKQLERESLNQLYSTKHTIGMMELTNTKTMKMRANHELHKLMKSSES